MKKIMYFFTVLVLCLMLPLCSCGNNKEQENEKLSYVSLDINPAIELVVDSNNKVVSVRGENEDGQILLYEENIEGMNIQSAVKRITDLAVELGYLDETNSVVSTIVSSSDEELAALVLDKVNTTITATALDLGLTVSIDAEGAYSLLRKLNEFKAQHPNHSGIQGLTVQKFKLALSASETGDISLEAAVELNDSELIAMIKEANTQIEEFATKAYTQAKQKALSLYDKATELACYGVYTTFYLEKMLSHPTTAYYGAVYQMYASAAKGFSVIYDMASLAAELEEYPLNDLQIQAVLEALGMDESQIALLKNAEGDITVASIEAYADKLFKNMTDTEAAAKVKQSLTEALSAIEKTVKTEIGRLSEEYKTEIEAAITAAKETVGSIEAMTAVLPESIQTVLAGSITDLKDILGTVEKLLSDGSLDLEDIKAFSQQFDTKAKEYLERITSDLTEAELKELESRKEEAIRKMSAQKEEFEKSLTAAEEAARKKLSELKEARKTAGN